MDKTLSKELSRRNGRGWAGGRGIGLQVEKVIRDDQTLVPVVGTVSGKHMWVSCFSAFDQ